MTETLSEALVTINVKELLSFFDETPDWSDKHASAVVGVVGEDLNAACFQHYLKAQGATAVIRPENVTTGKQKGPRLDRWIEVEWPDGSETVFQAEIKGWSAHAISGEKLEVQATAEEVEAYKRKRWEHRWDSERRALKIPMTAKVLVEMTPPCDLEGKAIRPLLIFWEALGPREAAGKQLFYESEPSCDPPFGWRNDWPKKLHKFPELWVFSVSSYLRSIPDARISLPMPVASARFSALRRLFPGTV